MAEPRASYGSGVIWSYLQAFAARGITTLAFVVVGLFVGPTEFGVFALVAACLMFVELVCEQSLSQSLVQIPEPEPALIEAAFYAALLLGGLIAALMYLGAPWMAAAFDEPRLVELVRLAALSPLLIAGSAVPVGLLRRGMHYKQLTRRTVLASGLSSVLGIGLVATGWGAKGLLFQALCFQAVSLVVLWRSSAWRPGAHTAAAWRELPRIARLSAVNLSNKLFDFGETRGVELLVGAIGGVHMLGLYSFANKFAQTAFQTLASPVLEVTFASAARANDSEQRLSVIRSGQLIVGTLPAAGLLGLALGAGPLLHLAYGERWSDAAWPLAVLSLAYLLRGLLYVFGTVLLATSPGRAVLAVTSTRTLLTLAAAAGAMAWQAPSAATAAAFGFLAGVGAFPLSLFMTSRVSQLPYRSLMAIPLKILVALLGALGLYAGLFALLGGGVVVGLLAAALASAAFLGAALMLNAGVLVRQFQAAAEQPGGSRVAQLARLGLRAAQAAMRLRDAWGDRFFVWSMRLAIWWPGSDPRGVGKTLLIPADTSDISGSLGDEMLLRGVATFVDPASSLVLVNAAHRSEPLWPGQIYVKTWDRFQAGWSIGRLARYLSGVYVIGADVMDGFYRPSVSLRRLALLDTLSRAGVPATALGFSFNAAPAPAVLEAVRGSHPGVRFCQRDDVSRERFERLTGRSGELVADLAFLVQAPGDSAVAKRVSQWAAPQRAQGRRIVGININPHVVAHLAQDAESALARSVATCLGQLLDEGCSVVLIPHDFRAGCADLRVMTQVAQSLGPRPEVLLLDQPFTGLAIRGACRELDLLLSARMHLAIGGLMESIPVVGMQYQGKFEGLFRHFALGPEAFIAPEDALDPAQLHRFISGHLAHLPTLRAQVAARLPAVQALAARNRPSGAIS